jgi:alkylation response protein AidB-like acyl-CoA dehydrogenase
MIVGETGRAGTLVERALQIATVLQSAEAVGAAEHLLERTVQYTKDRLQFGRAIGGFQSVKHRLADLLVQLEAARAAARYAALAVADDRPDRDEAVAVAGSFVRDACAYLAGEALQIHGGIGFTWDHDVHLFVRRAKADQALYGEPSWHRERLTSIMEEREVRI